MYMQCRQVRAEELRELWGEKVFHGRLMFVWNAVGVLCVPQVMLENDGEVALFSTDSQLLFI